MPQAFTLYVQHDTRLHQLHPITKLVLSFMFLVFAAAAPGIFFAYIVLIALAFPLAVWGRFAGRYIRALLAIMIPLGISLLLIRGLFWRTGPVLLAIGPATLMQDGVIFAVTSIGRLSLVVSSFLLLSYSTPPDALMLALTERGLPGGIAYIILTTIQIVPRFQVRAQQIIDAQHARGLETEGSLIQRFRALLPLVVPLVLGSIVDVEERAIALEARAFSRQGPKTSLLVLTDTRAQAVARWLMAVAALAVVVLRFVPGGLH